MKELFIVLALLISNRASSQSINLQKMLEDGKLMFRSGNLVKSFQQGDYKGIACNGNVWVMGIDFTYGTIEIDIRGRNEFLNSFPGIAFYAADTSGNYDVVYFRPFNFRHADPVRRTWSVQYMSLPEYPYDRLRKENTGQFESEIIPNPRPEDWIHARILIQKDSIKVYVNGLDKPSLTVKTLQNRSKGLLGMWTDGTVAEFANLVITRNE